MRRPLVTSLAALIIGAASIGLRAQVGDGGYKLVPNWPKLPAGAFFGLKDAPPPPAERDAQAAARRAMGGQRAATQNTGGPTNQPGISGLAIDAQDRIYVFNRGAKPVMVFDTAGNLVMSGADQEINGKTINPSWQHSGAVDWDGNVYIIERDAHRIVKLSPKLDKFLMQLGTTNEKGNDADASSICRRASPCCTTATSSSPTATATIASCCSTRQGKFIKQVAKGAGGPHRQGQGPRRVGSAAQARRRRAGKPLHHRSRRPSPSGVRQEPELPRGRFASRAGTRGTSASHAKAPTASRSSPITRSSASTSSRSRTESFWPRGASRDSGPASSTGCTAS